MLLLSTPNRSVRFQVVNKATGVVEILEKAGQQFLSLSLYIFCYLQIEIVLFYRDSCIDDFDSTTTAPLQIQSMF